MSRRRPYWLAFLCLLASFHAFHPASSGAADGAEATADGQIDAADPSVAEGEAARQEQELLGPPAPPDAASRDLTPTGPPPAGATGPVVPPIKRVMPKPAAKPTGKTAHEASKGAAKSKVKKEPAAEASAGKSQNAAP